MSRHHRLLALSVLLIALWGDRECHDATGSAGGRRRPDPSSSDVSIRPVGYDSVPGDAWRNPLNPGLLVTNMDSDLPGDDRPIETVCAIEPASLLMTGDHEGVISFIEGTGRGQ